MKCSEEIWIDFVIVKKCWPRTKSMEEVLNTSFGFYSSWHNSVNFVLGWLKINDRLSLNLLFIVIKWHGKNYFKKYVEFFFANNQVEKFWCQRIVKLLFQNL